MNDDVLILGAGTAGSVLARRLLDAGLKVTLVEAGGDETNPALHDLARGREPWGGPEDWQWFSAPQKNALDRRLHLPRGKVVGGSGQLNGAIYVRGSQWDYDRWAELGNAGWDWASVEPLFERIENRIADGEGLDRAQPDLSPIQQSIIDAAVAWGLPLNPDYNAGELDGVSRMQQNLRDGKRLSTWAAYMRPVLGHPNLTLRTNTLVDRLAIENGRVTGVHVVTASGTREKLSAGMVVLASGSLASPGVLLRSGIGPVADLERLGVEVIADVPGVGKNLQDHFLVPVVYGTERPVDPPRSFHPVIQTHWFWKSDPSLPVPDTQPINFSVPVYYDPSMTGPASGFTMHAAIIRPYSTGTVTLSSLDPAAEPVIDFGLFEDERDLKALVASIRQVREVGRQAPLAQEWGAYEALPGPSAEDSDEALAAWARRGVNTYHHMVGTCRMGTDADAVVTPQLRLAALEGLMIADASIMPQVTTGNTNAPSAMIAEKAAELLLG